MEYFTALTIAVLFAFFLAYKLGWLKHEKQVLQSKVDDEKQLNEILKKQRDNTIDSVDDANSMWNEHRETD